MAILHRQKFVKSPAVFSDIPKQAKQSHVVIGLLDNHTCCALSVLHSFGALAKAV